MTSVRFEMRVPDDLMQRVDAARGHESRASFVKRALVKAVSDDDAREVIRGLTSNGSAFRDAIEPKGRGARAAKKPAATGDLPKIAPRRWAK